MRQMSWLWEKYAQQRLTDEMERQFVYDVDRHLENLATNLDNSDFMALMSYFIELSKKHWDTDQRRAFAKRVQLLRDKFHHEQNESLSGKMAATIRACDTILAHRYEPPPPAKKERSLVVQLFRVVFFGAIGLPVAFFGLFVLTTPWTGQPTPIAQKVICGIIGVPILALGLFFISRMEK